MSGFPTLETRSQAFIILLTISFLFFLSERASRAGADEVAKVRTNLDSDTSAWVGQEVSFSIDLMSSTFFSGTAHFDLPNVSGVILMKSAGSPVVSSENVDGDTWSIQRHTFSAYAHRPGGFEIPSFLVRFSVAPAFGKPPEQQRLTTQPVSFEVKLPPGAEGLSLLISTPNLEVTESWSPTIPDDGKIELEIGDALTRKISLTAKDVPGMALPPIQLPGPEGMSAYPDQPVVADKQNRGDLTGQRSESTTFVCERAGEFQLPAVVVPWWNSESESLSRVTLPMVNVFVASPPDAANLEAASPSQGEESPAGKSLVWGLIGLVTISVLGIFALYYREAIAYWIASIKSQRHETESACFARLQKACVRNQPVEALNALNHWLESQWNGPGVVTIDALLDRRAVPPNLEGELKKLECAAIGKTQTWSGKGLARALVSVRGGKRSMKPVWSKYELPALNPSGLFAATESQKHKEKIKQTID